MIKIKDIVFDFFFLLNLLNTVFLNNRHLLHKAHNEHTQMLAITWGALNAVCGAAGIILQFHHHHSWPKASDDVHTSSSAWRSPTPITWMGDISGGGAWRRHYMGQWPFLQSQGVFLSCTESVYPPPPPLPLMPRQGLMGTSVTSNGRPSEHKQLCLLPQPLVLTVATAPCPSSGPSCISSTAEGLSSPTHQLLGHYYVLKGFCFITPPCWAIFFLHFTL